MSYRSKPILAYFAMVRRRRTFRLFRTRLDRLTTWAQSLDELAKTASKRKALVDRTPPLLSLPSKIRNFCHDNRVRAICDVRFTRKADVSGSPYNVG